MTGLGYRVEFAAAAARQLRKLDPPAGRRLLAAAAALGADPRPPGATALRGRRGYLRVRHGEHRIVYRVEDEHRLVIVVALGHRGTVYR